MLWGKVQFVPICSTQKVQKPDGSELEGAESMSYLGSTLHGDGTYRAELNRKLGASAAEFRSLDVVWKNRRVSRKRKLTLFDAVIGSRLRYATASAWLSRGDL